MSQQPSLYSEFQSGMLQNLEEFSAGLEKDLQMRNSPTFDFDDWLKNADITNSEPDQSVLEMLKEMERECSLETKSTDQNEISENVSLALDGDLQNTHMGDDAEQTLDCLNKAANELCLKIDKDKNEDFHLFENLLTFEANEGDEEPPFLHVENPLLKNASPPPKSHTPYSRLDKIV